MAIISILPDLRPSNHQTHCPPTIVPVNLVCMFCSDFGKSQAEHFAQTTRRWKCWWWQRQWVLGPGAKTWQSIHSKTRSQSETAKLVIAKLLSQKPDDFGVTRTPQTLKETSTYVLRIHMQIHENALVVAKQLRKYIDLYIFNFMLFAIKWELRI